MTNFNEETLLKLIEDQYRTHYNAILEKNFHGTCISLLLKNHLQVLDSVMFIVRLDKYGIIGHAFYDINLRNLYIYDYSGERFEVRTFQIYVSKQEKVRKRLAPFFRNDIDKPNNKILVYSKSSLNKAKKKSKDLEREHCENCVGRNHPAGDYCEGCYYRKYRG